jgi:hypothetical protein
MPVGELARGQALDVEVTLEADAIRARERTTIDGGVANKRNGNSVR